jgi:hypothetical protein
MRILFLSIIFSVFLFSCEEEEQTVLENAQISFQFKHYYKSQVLEIRADNNLIYTTETQNNWNVKSLKYYVSKIIVYKDSGESYDVNMYKFINLSETNSIISDYILKDIPDGRYTKISFIFGIDSARNLSFALENNTENNSMEWPSQLGGGYHIMMMDGVFLNNQNQLSGYGIHLGKQGNQVKLEFPIEYTAKAGAKATIQLNMNVDQWLDGFNKINLNDGYGYIMENDAKQLLFKQNATSSVFSIIQQ